MAAPISRFNRLLLILMVALYLISLGAFTYVNWMVDLEHIWWAIAVNALILSIPLVLFYGSIYVLISAWREHSLTGKISPRLANVVHWAPRLAAILIIFFVSLFSLDVFEMEGTPLELLGAFLIHSLPSIILIVLLFFAWRRPVVGFVAFLLAGLLFLPFAITDLNLGHFLLFSGPMLLISGLFFADWRWHAPQPPTPIDAAV
ncbi:MAG: hypothetical protein P8074_22405 [Anaerolineales bacterium]|jgi:hypothetical protein